MIQFKCIYCGEEMEAPQSLAGEKLGCPNCNHRVPVPRAGKRSAKIPAAGSAKSKICSQCLNTIPPKASKCPFCGTSLTTPQTSDAEMLVRFECTKCGEMNNVPEALKGQVVKCTHCGLHEIVPQKVNGRFS